MIAKSKIKYLRRKNNSVCLTGYRLSLYNDFILQIKKKFELSDLPFEWEVNLCAFLQEVDDLIFNKIALRITNEMESLKETRTGVFIGYYYTLDDYYFIWIETPD